MLMLVVWSMKLRGMIGVWWLRMVTGQYLSDTGKRFKDSYLLVSAAKALLKKDTLLVQFL